MRKLISPLNVEANNRKYKKLLKSISCSENLDGKELNFQP